MLALVLLSLIAAGIAQTGDFTVLPSAEVDYLIERINHYRATLDFTDITLAPVERDTTIDLTNTVSVSFVRLFFNVLSGLFRTISAVLV
jgi:hypothetical protein